MMRCLKTLFKIRTFFELSLWKTLMDHLICVQLKDSSLSPFSEIPLLLRMFPNFAFFRMLLSRHIFQCLKCWSQRFITQIPSVTVYMGESLYKNWGLGGISVQKLKLSSRGSWKTASDGGKLRVDLLLSL